MKLKLRHRSLAILLAVTIILGVSLPLIATATDDTSGGFSLDLYWNMSDANVSSDRLTYNYDSVTDETKALRLALRYSNKDMGDIVYAPGEVVVTVTGLGTAFRDGTKAADSIGADKASDTVKNYAWSYIYTSSTDTYTFTNNNTLSSAANFAGSFEILWMLPSRETVTDYSTTISAQLTAKGGVKVNTNSVRYTQTRTKDGTNLRHTTERVYPAGGLTFGNVVVVADHWWVEFTATSLPYERSIPIKDSYFEVLLPDGAVITSASGKDFVQTGQTVIVNSVVYNVWKIDTVAHSVKDRNGTYPSVSITYTVRYEKAKFPGQSELQHIVRVMGTFYDLNTGYEELVRDASTDLRYGDYEIIQDPQGQIFNYMYIPNGTGAGSAFASAHDTNCRIYGYMDSRHLQYGGGTYSFDTYVQYKSFFSGFEFVNLVHRNESFDVLTTAGTYKTLTPEEYRYKAVVIGSLANVTNEQRLPVQSGVYPVELYIQTTAGGAYTLYHTTTLLNSEQRIELPDGVCGVQVRISDLAESLDPYNEEAYLDALLIRYVLDFHVGEDAGYRLSDGDIYSTLLVDHYGYSSSGSIYTKDNPKHLGPNSGDDGYTYSMQNAIHVLEVPNYYYATASFSSEGFTEQSGGVRTSRAFFGTNFSFSEGDEISDFSMYTILPEGVSLPVSVVDTEALYDVIAFDQRAGLSGSSAEATLMRALKLTMIKNYQGTGRTYIEFRFQFSTPLKPDNTMLNLSIPIEITLDDFAKYGPSFQLENVVMAHDKLAGAIPLRGAAVDDGSYAILGYEDLWSDINQNGETTEAVSYILSTAVELAQAAAIETGISKLVATKSTGSRFIQPSSTNGVYDDDEIPLVSTNDTYQYRLRLAPIAQDDSAAKDIVILDVLETGSKANWQGTLVSVDTSEAEKLLTKINGTAVKAAVYYSDTDYSVQAATDGYKPDLTDSSWSMTQTAGTRSIAIDFGDAQLYGEEYLYVDITMRAPNVSETDPMIKTITENNSYVTYTEMNLLAGSEEEIWLPSNEVPVKLMPFMATVSVVKTDATDGSVLTGVQFDLYRQLGASPNTGTDLQVETGLTTNIRGIITIRNLEAGTYYLIETDTLNGYVRITEPIVFTVGTESEITVSIENTRKDGIVTLEKVSDRNHDTTIAGAVFSLYRNDGTLYQGGLTTDSNGKITVNGLPWGDYYFIETSSPAGYEDPDQTRYEFTINAENDAGELLDYIRVVNKQYPAYAVLTKYERLEDGTATTTPVQGASYWLYDLAGNTVGFYITDAQGKIYAEDLAFGSYYFKELVAATGYELFGDEIHFSVDETNISLAAAKQIITYDQRLKGSIWLQKTDDTGAYVQGAVYQLYRKSDNVLISTGTTNSEGILEFTDLVWGKYYIRELASPQGYELDLNTYDVTIDAQSAGKSIILDVVDNRLQGSVRLIKTDEGGTRLNGAVFNLYRNDGTLVASGLTTATVNGQDGVIEVNKLDWGSYYFEETQAPAGYVLSDEKVRFSISSTNCGITLEVDFINALQGKEITLTKEIAYDELVFAHGNPTFIFKLTGTDAGGKTHTWYKSVVFTKAYADANVSGGVVKLSVTFNVPAGTYTASEEDVIRYELSSIKGISSNATANQTAGTVQFNMTTLDSGSATFVNGKEIQSGTSGTSHATNIVKSNRKLVAITAEYSGPATVNGEDGIDKNDLVVWAYYDDDTSRQLSASEYTLEHEPFTASMTYTITVVYTENGITRRAYFDVDVIGEPPKFIWAIENGEAYIIAYKGDSKVVNFPSEVTGTWTFTFSQDRKPGMTGWNKEDFYFGPDQVNGTYTADGKTYKVAGIGHNNHRNTLEYRAVVPEDTTQVIIPEGVRELNNYAFTWVAGLTSIASVSMPTTLTKLGDSVFYRSGLTGNLDLYNTNITEIGYGTFHTCTGITGTIRLPKNLTSIGDNVFIKVPYTRVEIGDALTATGYATFAYETVTSSYTVPPATVSWGGLTTFGQYAFAYRSFSGGLAIPDTIKEIGGSAFKQADFNNGPLNIGSSSASSQRMVIKNEAFIDAKNITQINILNGVAEIGEANTTGYYFAAFSGAFSDSTTRISISADVEKIYNYAFHSGNGGVTDNITQLQLAANSKLTYVGTSAFSGTVSYITNNVKLPNTIDSACSSMAGFSGFGRYGGGILQIPSQYSPNTFGAWSSFPNIRYEYY